MTAATLLVGRGFLRKIPKGNDVRKYIMLAQSQSWDEAYGSEDDETCPRIPQIVRRLYAKMVLSRYKRIIKEEEISFQMINRQKLNEKRLDSFSFHGGFGEAFASALMWAVFTTEHRHHILKLGEWTYPKLGDMILIVRPKHKRFHEVGVILSLTHSRQHALVEFENGDKDYVDFMSFVNMSDLTMHPIALPPEPDTLESARTLLQTLSYYPSLQMFEFSNTLTDILLYGNNAGYVVVGMLLSIENDHEGHEVAAFPCPTFEMGWMFCNTWKFPFGECIGPKEFFSSIKRVYGRHSELMIPRVSILYRVK